MANKQFPQQLAEALGAISKNDMRTGIFMPETRIADLPLSMQGAIEELNQTFGDDSRDGEAKTNMVFKLLHREGLLSEAFNAENAVIQIGKEDGPRKGIIRVVAPEIASPKLAFLKMLSEAMENHRMTQDGCPNDVTVH